MTRGRRRKRGKAPVVKQSSMQLLVAARREVLLHKRACGADVLNEEELRDRIAMQLDVVFAINLVLREAKADLVRSLEAKHGR